MNVADPRLPLPTWRDPGVPLEVKGGIEEASGAALDWTRPRPEPHAAGARSRPGGAREACLTSIQTCIQSLSMVF